MPAELFTRWGKNIDPDRVLQEYPRPGLRRGSYTNLNGYWQYAFTSSADIPEEYEGEILVPFSPEAPLSGVNRQLKPDEYLHYRRVLHLEKIKPHTHFLLHFDAVDQTCQVYVNGTQAASHTGGYLPFTVDITEFVREGDNLLQVVVKDLSDTSYHAKGKQSLERGGMWYTAQSGIWQTVWMEEVPQYYITNLKMTPDYDEGCIRICVMTNREEESLPVSAVISFGGVTIKECSFTSGQTVPVPLGDFHPWSPEHPHLYDIHIDMQEDAADSYFAMRKISVETDENGFPRMLLNNRLYFQSGLLDQGYYPDGLYTPPSDEAMIYDIKTMKGMGFNMLRKHIKIEPQRWYYHCDRLGMLVWQDMVCGGRQYNYWFITVLPNALPWNTKQIRDNNDELFSRQDPEGKKEYIVELKETIRLLYNHPSIAVWVLFNEGWGQFDAERMCELARSMDSTRLIDEASGWYDQGGGDIRSVHNYLRKLRVLPQKDRVMALSECGGYSLRDPDHSFSSGEKTYGYRLYETKQELMAGITGLWEDEIIPNIANGLSATVYTQVSDVEDEVNGLLTYDREVIKVDEDKMRDLNRMLIGAYENG